MTIINSNRCVQATPDSAQSRRTQHTERFDTGVVSIELATMIAVANDLFIVSLDLATEWSRATGESATRIDQAIGHIDDIISSIRQAAMPHRHVREQR